MSYVPEQFWQITSFFFISLDKFIIQYQTFCSLSNIRAPPEHDQEADGQRGQHEAGAAEQGYQVRDHAGGPHDGEEVSILVYFPRYIQ